MLSSEHGWLFVLDSSVLVHDLRMESSTAHLSHDSTYGDPCIKLDIKAKKLNRERNQREERALQFKSRVLDRAKFVMQRTLEHEQRVLSKSLGDLHTKTPYLSALMGRSRESRGNHSCDAPVLRRKKSKQMQSPVVGLPNEQPAMATGPQKPLPLPFRKTLSLPSLVVLPDTDEFSRQPPPVRREGIVNSPEGILLRNRFSDTSLPVLTSTGRQDGAHAQYIRHHSAADVGSSQRLNRFVIPPAERYIKPSTKAYLRRTKYLSKSLENLYRKREERNAEDADALESQLLPSAVISYQELST